MKLLADEEAAKLVNEEEIRAAALANAFVQAYTDTTLELRVDPARQYSGFFDSRAKAYRDNFEKAQDRLAQFQKEKGLLVTDERLDIETARLAELSSQLVGLQALGFAPERLARLADRESRAFFAHPEAAHHRG